MQVKLYLVPFSSYVTLKKIVKKCRFLLGVIQSHCTPAFRYNVLYTLKYTD